MSIISRAKSTATLSDPPEPVPRSPVHLQPLALRSRPENCQIWLVPNVNGKASSHSVRIDVRDKLSEIRVPGAPVIVVAWVNRRGVLCTIRTPEIVNQEDELGIIFASSPVIGKGGCEAVLY